ncbi:hypothetical protein D7X33_15435 [Butyricicoccus sp. 1XD8-22]|nr:hypothetical protein D7X33_15435 [Butyricicoccus sp. 1XD8-22]
MSENTYGFTLTRQGIGLIAKVLAAKLPLTITRVMMGSGQCPEGGAADLTDLVEPVAAGTSTEPLYDGDTVRMTIEYRSDLNGGLDHGFWIREFGIFALDTDGAEVLLYYGTLGDYPQYVSAYSRTGVDVRRYPVTITVGEGVNVVVDYRPAAFMTPPDVEEFCMVTVLPQFLAEAQKLIDRHNADPAAHSGLQGLCAALDARISLLELMYGTDVSGNPFTVTFENITGLVMAGVWNEPQKRLEF